MEGRGVQFTMDLGFYESHCTIVAEETSLSSLLCVGVDYVHSKLGLS